MNTVPDPRTNSSRKLVALLFLGGGVALLGLGVSLALLQEEEAEPARAAASKLAGEAPAPGEAKVAASPKERVAEQVQEQGLFRGPKEKVAERPVPIDPSEGSAQSSKSADSVDGVE